MAAEEVAHMPPVEITEIAAPKIESPAADTKVVAPVETTAKETAPAAKVEGSPAETKAPQGEDDFAKRIAIVAKKDQAATAKLTQAKQIEKEYSPLKATRERAAQGDNAAMLEWLSLGGITYEQVTKAILAHGKVDPTAPLKQGQSALEARLAKIEADKQAEVSAAEQQRASQKLEEFKEEIATFTKAVVKDAAGVETQSYPYIVANDATQLVYDVIAEKFHETKASGKPIILTIEQAAKGVEAHLAALAAKQPGYKAPEKKSETPQPVTTAPAAKPDTGFTSEKSPKTLTNVNATVQTRPANTRMSDEERLRRAAELLKL